MKQGKWMAEMLFSLWKICFSSSAADGSIRSVENFIKMHHATEHKFGVHVPLQGQSRHNPLKFTWAWRGYALWRAPYSLILFFLPTSWTAKLNTASLHCFDISTIIHSSDSCIVHTKGLDRKVTVDYVSWPTGLRQELEKIVWLSASNRPSTDMARYGATRVTQQWDSRRYRCSQSEAIVPTFYS